MEKSLNFLLLLLRVDIPFDCIPLAADYVNNTPLFAMFNPKIELEKLTGHEELLLLTVLLLLDEEALVANESGGLSPALDKECAEPYSLLRSRVLLLFLLIYRL